MKLFSPEIPIDIVYTWVDGNSESYRSLYNQYARKGEDINPERYRDIYTMLRYSLRSVENYVSWYRNIYIITQRPQVPDWLNLSHPRIKIVHHDEIFSSEKYLPTFNSMAIETCVHRIPNLSELFLYLEDDYLFGSEISKEDFMTADKKIKIYGTLWGERFKFRVYWNKLNFVSLGFIEHTPLLVHKNAWDSMLEEWADETHKTRMHKFREDDDLQVDKLYRYFMLSKMRHLSVSVPAFKLLRIHRFHKITNNLRKQMKNLRRLKEMKPKFYCLNDDQRDHPDIAVVRLVKDFLEEYYPEPSSFEK